MLNDIANELSNSREEKLLGVTNDVVTSAVFDQLREIAPGSQHGLPGVDAENGNLTRPLWDQAVYAASSNASIVFGAQALYRHDLTDLQPVTYNDVMEFIANRVAMAILVAHGIISAPR